MNPQYLVQTMPGIVAKVSATKLPELKIVDNNITGVHFKYGHPNDIKNELLLKGKVNPEQKYPLIVLFEDFKLAHRQPGITGIATLTMIILMTSQKAYTRQERENRVFIPVLRPIYEEFLKQLKLSGKFMIYDESTIRHDQIDRPHWGDPEHYKTGPKGNESYIFQDCLDGIELSNLQLITYLKNCQ